MIDAVLIGLVLFSAVQAGPSLQAVDPTVSGTPQVLGIVSDPKFNRDSCSSVAIHGRAFWTCRDTQNNRVNGLPKPALIASSTSAWSDLNADGSPKIEPLDGSATGKGNKMYAHGDNPPFYQYIKRECGDSPAGICSDGTRWAIWPDSAPMPGKTGSDGTIPAYTWIRQSHIRKDLSAINPDPPTSLYRSEFKADAPDLVLPKIFFVGREFYDAKEISFGNYGNVVRGGVAYLYGQPSNGKIGVAKVAVGDVEDSSKYSYWVNGAWRVQKPGIDGGGYDIHATAGGQGTFYYSDAWSSYVWIGQESDSGTADFFITTAPKPQGPWTRPKKFYTGTPGNSSPAAFSLQAHPGMVPAGKNQIYLTYTKTDEVNGENVYSTPLIRVNWQ